VKNAFRTSAIAAAALLSLAPMAANAGALGSGNLSSNSVVVKATVVPDCVIATQPTAILNFGTQDKNASQVLATSEQATGMTVTCNNGTAWTASVPASVTLAGFTDTTMAASNGSSITATLALSQTGGTASGSGTAIPFTVTASIAPGDFPVGYYQGSFVVSVSY
jgi:spore coat protein U-like protein